MAVSGFVRPLGWGRRKIFRDYELTVIDGINLYLPQWLDSPYPLTLEVHSLFGVKTLSIEGWKLV